jgi:hypothetical protein
MIPETTAIRATIFIECPENEYIRIKKAIERNADKNAYSSGTILAFDTTKLVLGGATRSNPPPLIIDRFDN